MALFARYDLLHEREDLEQSILHYTEAILLPQPLYSECCLSTIENFLYLIGALLRRSRDFDQPEDINDCIKYLHYLRGQVVEPFGVERSGITSLLVQALAVQVQFRSGGTMQDFEEMAILCREFLTPGISSAHVNSAIQALSGAILLKLPPQEPGEALDQVIECLREVKVHHPELRQVPLALAYSIACRIESTHSSVGYEEAMGILGDIIPSYSPGIALSPHQEQALEVLGLLVLARLSMSGDPEYLEEAVYRFRNFLTLASPDHPLRPLISQVMGHYTGIRSDNFGVMEGPQVGHSSQREVAAIPSFSALTASLVKSNAVKGSSLKTGEEFQHLVLARGSGPYTASAAYANAISLMQESLAFAPTLEIQHFRLVSMREYYETLPLDYASYLVHTGRLEQAIETLERGRALLWSEMRGLRPSIDQLCAADSALAEKFAAVNRELEMLTTSSSPSGIEITNGGVNGHVGMDPFDHLVVKQRKLLGERDRVISQVRTLSGFEGFLTAPSFDTLRSAASRGPVIIINHCKWRSNILILLHESPPSNITTTDDFYEQALGLGDRLAKARKEHRLESKQYQRALRSVLKILYDLVGRPVIEELRRLKIPEQSRVWWCPTSVFCTLPLHAMGPIPSDNEAKRYFLDLYISSYTPTLSALIESRRIDGQTLEKPSILLVAQPDESLLNAWEEIWVIQRLSAEVTTLISKNATPSRVVDGLQHHRFSHFACHGKLEVGKPFNASLKLYGGERLTLLNIVRSRLPTADFAFLSASHTAELTEDSIADEALHLTAAMQYSGFRSVVGTMWAMADTDGRDLAEHFYKSLFSSEEPGVPYYELSARALRDAVRNLRRKKVLLLERWVNFVHYGA